MEEKKERCRRCRAEFLHATSNPHEKKCDFCGWIKVELDLKDYLAAKGYIAP